MKTVSVVILVVMLKIFLAGLSIKNIIMSSFKSSRNIQRKECGPDRSVSDNQSSLQTLYFMPINCLTHLEIYFQSTIDA